MFATAIVLLVFGAIVCLVSFTGQPQGGVGTGGLAGIFIGIPLLAIGAVLLLIRWLM